jgi:glycosyltransferase involved in cell wall biosynthesis
MRDDALDLYDALDLCLMTSSFEGLPVFLLDGLAREIPCVAPAVGDIPLLLESGGGVVVEAPGDIDGLVAGIRTLMDPERRGLEGRLGRSRIEHRFGTERFVSDYQAAIFPER